MRIPATSPDRTGARFVAFGLLSFGLSNVLYAWSVQALDSMAVPTLSQLLGGTYYLCVSIALVLLMRSRLSRLPLSLWLDGLVVGLGVATVAAVVMAPGLVSVLGKGFSHSHVNLVYPMADLLLLALLVGAMSLFRWRPPPSLWWLAGGLMVFGFVDCIYVTQAARGTYPSGGVFDAGWMVAVTVVVGISAGGHPIPGDLAAAWGAPCGGSVLVACGYVQITQVAVCLAVATLLGALGTGVLVVGAPLNERSLEVWRDISREAGAGGTTQTGVSSTPASATASSRLGAVTTARKPSPSFHMLAFSVSPGNTTPAIRAP